MQPVQATVAEGPPLRKLKDAAADVGAQVVQVAVHRIRAAAEVQVVREVQRQLVPELLCNLHSGCGTRRINHLKSKLHSRKSMTR